MDSRDESPQQGVLILLSTRHGRHPYRAWLNELDCPLIGIAHGEMLDSASFDIVRSIDSWRPDIIVEQALQLHDIKPFDRVIGLGEVDVLPAAQIRELLGIPGQQVQSARAYRDKLLMRQVAADHGISVPAFAQADTSDDVRRFIQRHGLPVMVKPRLGVGARGIRMITRGSPTEIFGCVEGGDRHLVESFVEGPTFHVEALYQGGTPMLSVPCAYVGRGCLSHWWDDGTGSYTLPIVDPLHSRLVTATDEVVAAMPGCADLAIHAEFFLADDTVVLCEVASRCGGGAIPTMMRRRLGMDMRELWVRVQCRLPVSWNSIGADARREGLVGNFGLPPRDGRLIALPTSAPSGVEDLTINAAANEDFSGSRYKTRLSGDRIATWALYAEDVPQMLGAIERSAREVGEMIKWDIA